MRILLEECNLVIVLYNKKLRFSVYEKDDYIVLFRKALNTSLGGFRIFYVSKSKAHSLRTLYYNTYQRIRPQKPLEAHESGRDKSKKVLNILGVYFLRAKIETFPGHIRSYPVMENHISSVWYTHTDRQTHRQRSFYFIIRITYSINIMI